MFSKLTTWMTMEGHRLRTRCHRAERCVTGVMRETPTRITRFSLLSAERARSTASCE